MNELELKVGDYVFSNLRDNDCRLLRITNLYNYSPTNLLASLETILTDYHEIPQRRKNKDLNVEFLRLATVEEVERRIAGWEKVKNIVTNWQKTEKILAEREG